MTHEGYQLKSELARVCLPRPQGDPGRALAWVNSICLLFLVVAWSGLRPHLPQPRMVAPLDEPVPIIIQPLATPPPQATPETRDESTDDKTPAPKVVVVTPNSPAINFSVPTVGNVLVPNAVAPAPPVAPLKTAPAATAPEQPESTGNTGEGGDRPQPPYPEMALKLGKQGSVVLLFTVNGIGRVDSISIKESSGSPILDGRTLLFVMRRWRVPPGKAGRVFETTISYRIETD